WKWRTRRAARTRGFLRFIRSAGQRQPIDRRRICEECLAGAVDDQLIERARGLTARRSILREWKAQPVEENLRRANRLRRHEAPGARQRHLLVGVGFLLACKYVGRAGHSGVVVEI